MVYIVLGRLNRERRKLGEKKIPLVDKLIWL